MSIWQWIYDFEMQAYQKGDTERMRLVDIYQTGMQSVRTDPDRTLAFLEQGRTLAQQLNEAWWVLFYDHWKLQVLIFHKRDYTAALDLAVRSAVETRKPQYASLPQRVCLHEDLIYAYLGIDPVGNAQLIENALNYMEGQMSPDIECRHCLQELRHEFQLAIGNTEQAMEEAMRALVMAQTEGNDHHQTYAYATLCKIFCDRGDWQGLEEMAGAGEECARRTSANDMLGELLVWQAVAKRRLGDQMAAERSYRTAASILTRLGSVPRPGCFDALGAYQEVGGDLERALAVRNQEFAAIRGKGQVHAECQCLLKRCRLMAELGQLLEADVAAARETAKKLINPEPFLAEVERVERAGH